METVNILSALLTPIIAILAVYIAYQQFLNNKKNIERQHYLDLKKINLDLYHKRYRIFDESKQLLLKVNKYAKIDIIELRDFKFSINECKFLFGEEIEQYFQEIQKKAISLSHLTEDLNEKNIYPVNSNKREQLVKKRSKLIEWFTNEYNNIEVRFVKYLDFRIL